MKLTKIKLVCFSPTGTTRSIIKAIAQGFGEIPVELYDLTLPEAKGTL